MASEMAVRSASLCSAAPASASASALADSSRADSSSANNQKKNLKHKQRKQIRTRAKDDQGIPPARARCSEVAAWPRLSRPRGRWPGFRPWQPGPKIGPAPRRPGRAPTAAVAPLRAPRPPLCTLLPPRLSGQYRATGGPLPRHPAEKGTQWPWRARSSGTAASPRHRLRGG
jgi:hypothetical protein